METRLAEEQALAMSDLLEYNLQNLATKSDLQFLEQRMVIKLGTLMVVCIGSVAALNKFF